MAGSRLELIGTVYSRMHGLLRTKAIKYEDRPIWFDVYRIFPPKLEPHYDRQPVLPLDTPSEIPELIYKEDIPRAAFFKKFGLNPGGLARNLTSTDKIDDACVRFIENYNQTQIKYPNWTHNEIIESISKNVNIGFLSTTHHEQQYPTSLTTPKVTTTTTITSQFKIDDQIFKDSYEDDNDDDDNSDSITQHDSIKEEQQQQKSRTRGTKRTIVTAQTLLSMFNEAKLKSQQKKDDDSG